MRTGGISRCVGVGCYVRTGSSSRCVGVASLNTLVSAVL